MLKPMLIVMTRWPAPRRCKTRLGQEIGYLKASRIQKRLTNHTIAVAKRIKEKGLIELKLAIEGIGNQKIKKWAKSKEVAFASAQGIGTLGVKMKREIVHAQLKGGSSHQRLRDTILIGADVPNLCELDIIYALSKLKKNELVIGPSKDGGYWLIGFSSKIITPLLCWPFEGIRWGTNSVLQETLNRAKSKGIKYKLIGIKNDIDVIQDLNLWVK